MDIKILVAVHKPCNVPSGGIYFPVQVGRALHPALENIAGDNTGPNISEKNPQYCELTALYWGWKNLDAEYLGLAHYRRYLAKPGWGHSLARLPGQKQLEHALQGCDILLPKKRHYWVETNYSQYIHAHHQQDLDITRAILAESWKKYLPAFDEVMRRRSGHRFNMFVMKKEIAQCYCTWLFAVLFELERRLDISHYSANDARVFGFVAERLLDVWLMQEGLPYRELPVLYTQPVNWLKKGTAFLHRKWAAGRAPGPTETLEKTKEEIKNGTV